MTTMTAASEETAMLAGDSAARVALESLLEPHGQQHVLKHWEELSVEQRVALARQILAIDFEQLDRLIGGDVASCDVEAIVDRVAPPPRAANR